MSCCDSCQQGRGCDGLGELPAVSSYVVAGSVIAWGGFVSDSVGNNLWDDRIEGLVKNALWQTGGFSWVDAGRIGGFLNHYISIKVQPRVDFAKLEDVLRTIEGAIYQAGFRPVTENFWVESVPASAASNPDAAQPGTGGGRNTPGSNQSGFPSISLPNLPDIFNRNNNPNKPDCWNTTTSWPDYIACELGITRGNAVLVGAAGALLAVVVLRKVVSG